MHRSNGVSVLKFIRFNRGVSTSLIATETPLTIEDMPRPRSFPVIGTKLEFIASGSGTKVHEFIDKRHKQLGPIFCEKLYRNANVVFISDPMLIRTLFVKCEGKYPEHILPEPWILYEKLYGSKRGLFFMNGDEWLEHRRVMNKYLLKAASEYWFEKPVKRTINTFIQKWKIQAEENGSFVPNLESEFYRLSIDIVIAVMLGSNSAFKTGQHYEELLTKFSEEVKKIFKTTTKLAGLPLNLCQKFNLKVWRDFNESVDISLYLAHKIVDEILYNRQEGNGLVKILADENVKDDDIRRLMGDFIIAAGDTTSYTSLWSLLLLSKHKNVTQELYLNTNQSYINHVVKESMRLYPVAPFITRILTKECILGSYRLNKGIPIIASIYTSGRDEQNFSKADEFLPYRWDRNDARKNQLENHVSSASLPFAMGARSCIGKKIATLQMTELISQIVQNFEFECLNKEEVRALTSQILIPDSDIKLRFTLRKPGYDKDSRNLAADTP